MKRLFILPLFFLLLHNVSTAQVYNGKKWPSAWDYQLKGKVRSWTMKNANGIARKMEFDPSGKITSDTHDERNTYVPDERTAEILKEQYEKPYEVKEMEAKKKLGWQFNHLSQLTQITTWATNEKSVSSLHNTFDAQGRLLSHICLQVQIHSGNETPEPQTNDSTATGAFFRYNAAGQITEFHYYPTDSFKALRLVWVYDQKNRLIERFWYDSYNMHTHSMIRYPKEIARKAPNDSLDLNKAFPHYWKQGTPYQETRKYDDNGNCIELVAYNNIVHGTVHTPGHKVVWEYDAHNKLTKQTQYDLYHNIISAYTWYDAKGNAIKETDFIFWTKAEFQYTYHIVYYP